MPGWTEYTPGHRFYRMGWVVGLKGDFSSEPDNPDFESILDLDPETCSYSVNGTRIFVRFRSREAAMLWKLANG